MMKIFSLLPFIILLSCATPKKIVPFVEPILKSSSAIVNTISTIVDTISTIVDTIIVDTTSTMNLFPNGKIIIADQPLPNSVYQNQKFKIIIDAFTKTKVATATGILIQPGKIITVRHILDDLNIKNPAEVKQWRGTIVTPTEFKQFKLSFKLSGKKETLEDILLLEMDRSFYDSLNLNNNNLTLSDSIFVGQTAYVSTIRTTTYKVQPIKNWWTLSLPVEIVNYTFQTKILSIINKPYIVDPMFVKLFKPLFRIKLNLIDGNSGSPVFDKHGNLIGMVIATDKANFSFVLSAKAIKEFLNF